MMEHFVITTLARDAVIEGDVERVREPLQRLATYQYDRVRVGSWSPWVTQLQRAAALTAQASTIELAAAGVATMGRICGDCHAATHGGPATLQPRKPKTVASNPLQERMQEHAWAVDQLWQGLTTPSDAAWNAGADVLAQVALDTELDARADYARMLQAVRELGVTSQRATNSEKRADVYGGLLATCAACHVGRRQQDR